MSWKFLGPCRALGSLIAHHWQAFHSHRTGHNETDWYLRGTAGDLGRGESAGSQKCQRRSDSLLAHCRPVVQPSVCHLFFSELPLHFSFFPPVTAVFSTSVPKYFHHFLSVTLHQIVFLMLPMNLLHFKAPWADEKPPAWLC